MPRIIVTYVALIFTALFCINTNAVTNGVDEIDEPLYSPFIERYVLDELKQLRSELIKIRRKRTPGMKLYQIESKQEMMKRGVKSPNLADSVMMSWGSAEESSYVYERRAVRARR